MAVLWSYEVMNKWDREIADWEADKIMKWLGDHGRILGTHYTMNDLGWYPITVAFIDYINDHRGNLVALDPTICSCGEWIGGFPTCVCGKTQVQWKASDDHNWDNIEIFPSKVITNEDAC
jgi:hypothetical protein